MIKFKGKKPCTTCPYLKTSKLHYWHKDHYKDLVKNDSDALHGPMYACHNNDSTICKGWLMNQRERGLPSIQLRLALSHNKIRRSYIDSIKCKIPMYETIYEMAKANYPLDF